MIVLNNKYLLLKKLKENGININDVFIQKMEEGYILSFLTEDLKKVIKSYVLNRNILLSSDNNKIYEILKDDYFDIVEFDEEEYLQHLSIIIYFWDCYVIEENFQEDYGREPTDEEWDKINEEEVNFVNGFLKKLEEQGLHNIVGSYIDDGYVLEFGEPTEEEGVDAFLKVFSQYGYSIDESDDEEEGYNTIDLYEFDDEHVRGMRIEIPKGNSLYYKLLG